jgi:SAM-dependent methyltransferase
MADRTEREHRQGNSGVVHQAAGLKGGGIYIPAEAYPYLVIQRGALDDMRGEPQVWIDRYAQALQSEYWSMEPYLPAVCHSILDVGSGMGGIDILLARHYGEGIRVTLMDGIDDLADMEWHSRTFNSMTVAKAFLAANQVLEVDLIDANDPGRRLSRYYDLVVSLKAWCFHIEPAEHLKVIAEAMHPGATLIVDVRRDRPEWEAQLCEHFQEVHVIYPGLKFRTIQYRRR